MTGKPITVEYGVKLYCPVCKKPKYANLPTPTGRIWCPDCGRTSQEHLWKREE